MQPDFYSGELTAKNESLVVLQGPGVCTNKCKRFVEIERIPSDFEISVDATEDCIVSIMTDPLCKEHSPVKVAMHCCSD